MPASYSRELSCALAAARAAGELQISFFSKSKRIDIKADASPVSEVDTACEEKIIATIKSEFPGDGFLGEESGAQEATNQRTWIIDPIDGTRPYLRNIPTFSTLIALEEHGSIVVGIMHFAGLEQTYYATAGNGAYCNEQPICVSTLDRMSTAMGSGLGFVERHGHPRAQQLFAYMQALGYYYGYMDAYSYASVASGKLDACVNILDKPWDCAPAALIVEEAGGRVSDIAGAQTIYSGSCVATNGVLHDTVLSFFKP
ncbi:MAG: hypothetical protein GF398_19635 [Chitinivibrionales bacterium]|nr:hypothetical protein [Chitinivibrionales bacterium]